MAKPSGFASGFSPGFGVGRYDYELASYQFLTSPMPHWAHLFPVVGAIDLRPLSAQAAAGGTPQGFAFVAAMQPQGGVAIAQSLHMSEANATSAMQDAWQSAMGYRPQGAKLVDLLWDQLTDGSDPTGESGPKPLMPTTLGFLELHVPGHSLVKRERFRFGIHPHTNRVQDLLRRDFERLWEGTNGDDHCRRVLDFTCKKYRVDDWHQFVPQRLHAHIPGLLPHATTISDNFNRANESLDAGSWVEVAGDWSVTSNQIVVTGSGWLAARHTTALSSDAHYAQVSQQDIGTSYHGPIARIPNSGATTFYQTSLDGTNMWIFKLVAGTQSNLASSAQTRVANDIYKVQADGSTIKSFINGAEISSVSDSAITGNLYCGMANEGGGAAVCLDDFEAADLAAPPAGNRRRRVITGAAA